MPAAAACRRGAARVAGRPDRGGASRGRFSRRRITPLPDVKNAAWASRRSTGSSSRSSKRRTSRPRRRPTSGRSSAGRLRPDRPAADAGGSRGVRRGRRRRRVREGGRPPARLARSTASAGARHWLDVVRYTDSFDARGIVGNRVDSRVRLAVPRLGRRTPSTATCPTTTSSSSRSPATCCPAPTPGKPFNKDGVVATGVYMIGEWGGGDADKEKLHHRHRRRPGRPHRPGVPGADRRLRPLPRPQVRPDLDEGLLRPGRHLLLSSHILSDPGPKGGSAVNVRVPLMTRAELEQRKADEARVAQLEQEIDAALDAQYAALAAADAAAGRQVPRGRVGVRAPAGRRSGRRSREFAQAAEPARVRAGAVGRTSSARRRSKLLPTPAQASTAARACTAGGTPASADTPVVVVNTTDQPIELSRRSSSRRTASTCTRRPTAGVAVRGRAPSPGAVRVTGKVDRRPRRLRRRHRVVALAASAATPPASSPRGTIANGGTQIARRGHRRHEARVDRRRRRRHDPARDPAEGRILVRHDARRAGDRRDRRRTSDWNLDAGRRSPDLHAGNPHADRYGNADGGYFHDLAGQAQAAFAAGLADVAVRRAVAIGASPATAARVRAAAGEVAQGARSRRRRRRKHAGRRQGPAPLADARRGVLSTAHRRRAARSGPPRATTTPTSTADAREQLAPMRAEIGGAQAVARRADPARPRACRKAARPRACSPASRTCRSTSAGRYDTPRRRRPPPLPAGHRRRQPAADQAGQRPAGAGRVARAARATRSPRA